LGSVARTGINSVSKMPNKHIMNRIKGLCEENKDSFEQVTSAVQNALKDKGVLEKGVKIIDATTEAGAREMEQVIKEELSRNRLLKGTPNVSKDLVSSLMTSMFQSGENAAYLPHTKTVVLSGDKLGLTVFHEAGHALNANASRIGKALQACRGASLLSIPIGLIAVWKRPKMEGEEPKTPVDKATTFVKKHAGKLAFASFLPMLIEEGMASIKGCKIAKTVSPEIFKATCKVNALAYLTYLGIALASGIGIAVARNIRDKIAINSMKKKQAQAQEQFARVQAQQIKQNYNNLRIPYNYGI
ncbi:hypothetical protein IKQ26_06280, partial [bacterium]|nr:hypothetical protein [bacterium]